jgi:NAD(P)-dependent dehydrogenase (short-subunit alcohol dehydrogenase family)
MNSPSQVRIPQKWQVSEISDLSGKRFLITGGTSGIGLEAARELARAGGEVIIAARNPVKAEHVAKTLGKDRVSWIEADFSSLLSVRSAARKVEKDIDVLILNAGVMAIPFERSEDGIEMQMAVNHFGQFAFAGLIEDRLKDRVISVSSGAHRMGEFGTGSIPDIQERANGVFQGFASDGKIKYSPWRVYGSSKLANLLFTFELERRARLKNRSYSALVVHPGYSDTNLQYVAAQLSGDEKRERAIRFSNKLIAQSAAMGALPTLCAATMRDIPGGSFIGPDGLFEMRGYPRFTRARSLAYDQQLAKNLWHVSEELTTVRWS